MSTGKKSPKVVISGYYGFDNCGDEAVLMSMLHCLKKLRDDISITVLSGNPERTNELYGVRSISRWNLLAISRELLGANLLISGGGSLIQDVTSVRSPAYYIGIIKIARLLRTKVMIYAQGIGPLHDEGSRSQTAKIMDRANAVTVRDNDSAVLLSKLGVKKDVSVTADPVLALNRDNVNVGLMSSLLLELGLSDKEGHKQKPLLFVSVRNWKDNRHLKPIAKLLDNRVDSGWDVVLVPAHYPDDVTLAKVLKGEMTHVPLVLERCLNAKEFLALAAISDEIFSMRLHGLICGVAVGTPVFGLSYDPKVTAFMEQCGLSDACIDFEDENLTDISDFSPKRCQNSDELMKLAWENAKIAVNLLN